MTREVKAAAGLQGRDWTNQEVAETGSSGGPCAGAAGPGALRQIGEVADRVGVSLRAVRYYEEQGLLVPEARTSGGFRLYSGDQIERLELIMQMKPLGFTVEETRALLQARDTLHDRTAADAEREAATARLGEFAAAAAQRCEELSTALERAGELARRLRREARAGAREGTCAGGR